MNFAFDTVSEHCRWDHSFLAIVQCTWFNHAPIWTHYMDTLTCHYALNHFQWSRFVFPIASMCSESRQQHQQQCTTASTITSTYLSNYITQFEHDNFFQSENNVIKWSIRRMASEFMSVCAYLFLRRPSNLWSEEYETQPVTGFMFGCNSEIRSNYTIQSCNNCGLLEKVLYFVYGMRSHSNTTII